MLYMPQDRNWYYYRPPNIQGISPYRPLIGPCPHQQRSVLFRRCSTLCSMFTVIFITIFILVMIAGFLLNYSRRVNVVFIDLEKPSHLVNDKFLSVGLDTITLANGFHGFNMSNPRLQKLFEAMSPGYLRIGGNLADRLIFSEKSSSTLQVPLTNYFIVASMIEHFEVDHSGFPNFTLTGQQWLDLNTFSRKVGLEIIFDLNALRRFDNGTWNPENAEELIRFSDRNGLYLNWELGNEPNSFRHKFNYEVNATQLGEDFITLKKILQKYPRYRNSLLVGPDVTRPRPDHKESEEYLKSFLLEAGHTLDATTWHQYYFDGRTVLPEDFLNPLKFDLLKWQIVAVKFITADANVPDIPIWLGETSSAYGGGAPGLSNRFIASFIWLDKLGIAAKLGLDLVIRQSIFHGNYALIDDSYNPTPDWWVSLLYKQLVSPKVVPCYSTSSDEVRLYCQCTKKDDEVHIKPSITVFGMNLAETAAKIRLQSSLSLDGHHHEAPYVYVYILTTRITLSSKRIYLNGDKLDLTSSNDIPALRPKLIPTQPFIELPEFSLAFMVLPVGNRSLC